MEAGCGRRAPARISWTCRESASARTLRLSATRPESGGGGEDPALRPSVAFIAPFEVGDRAREHVRRAAGRVEHEVAVAIEALKSGTREPTLLRRSGHDTRPLYASGRAGKVPAFEEAPFLPTRGRGRSTYDCIGENALSTGCALGPRRRRRPCIAADAAAGERALVLLDPPPRGCDCLHIAAAHAAATAVLARHSLTSPARCGPGRT